MATGRIPINGTAAIQETIVDAKGDLIVATGADAVARLAVGTDGHTLVADSSVSPTGLKWAAPAGGKVLQVVSSVTTTSTVLATTTLTDTTITATITPSASNSKVLVLIQANFEGYASGNDFEIKGSLLRGATAIQSYGNDFAGMKATQASGLILQINAPIIHLDSPNTTSATTYKFQSAMENTVSGRQVEFQRASSPSTITLLEIGA